MTTFQMLKNELVKAIGEYSGLPTRKEKVAAADAVDSKVLKAAVKLCEKYGIDVHWLFVADTDGNKTFIGSDGIDFLVDFFASNKIEDMAAFCATTSYAELKAKSIETEAAVIEEVAAASTENVVTEVVADEDKAEATEVVEAKSKVRLGKKGCIIYNPEIAAPYQDDRDVWIFTCIRTGKTGPMNKFYVPEYDRMRKVMNRGPFVTTADLPHFAVHFSALVEEMKVMRLLPQMADVIWAQERKREEERRERMEEERKTRAWQKFAHNLVLGEVKEWNGVKMARCVYRHDTVVPIADMRVPGLPEILARNNGKVPTEQELRMKFLCCPACQANEEPINRDGDLQIDDKSKMQTLQQADKGFDHYVRSLAKDKGLIK